MTDLQIIGGGQMGQALVGGLIASGWVGDGTITIVEVAEAQRTVLAGRFPAANIVAEPIANADTLIAVKPHFVAEVCSALPTPTRVMSIAAGITIAAIEACVPAGTPVIRAMPNTPALLGQGAAGLAGGTAASGADLAWAQGVLRSVGKAEIVTEAQLDAVTGLSGSGPAYVYLIAEALVDGAVTAGLPRDTAKILAHQTLLGAATMLVETGRQRASFEPPSRHPPERPPRASVSLELGGVRASIIDAVVAATARANELGKADAQ
ncbi:MAG: pyrroline-5-carboxylate reductase dimerization domain-containing protein [Acidimicrobiales bacterium]